MQLALRYVKTREDAEEVTQDVLFKAVEKIGDFRGDAALSSWLYRITFNTAMSRLRQLRSSRVPVIADADSELDDRAPAEDIADWSAMADEVVLRRQMQHRLRRALERLPAIYRAPVILRDVNGLTTEEASSRASPERADVEIASASRPAAAPPRTLGLFQRPGHSSRRVVRRRVASRGADVPTRRRRSRRRRW